MKRINKVAVLGAGTMGARIAAHLANAGVPTYLFDIVPPDADGPARNKIAAAGLEAAVKSKPAAFMNPSLACLVTVGNFEDDLKKLAEVDWIIEAVVEDLDIKRELLRKVEAVRKPGTIITTNTSGLPVGKIAEGFSDDFRRSWFGTHFFNPPRYMRLLEIIPTPDADRAAIDADRRLLRLRLGKGVVYAKDTPNFIANRIGTFSVLNVMRLMQEMDLSVEEVDALTGTPWVAQVRHLPHSSTWSGSTFSATSSATCTANIKDERSDLQPAPTSSTQMLDRKWLGDKTKGGFYKKQKGPTARKRVWPSTGRPWNTIRAAEAQVPRSGNGQEHRRHWHRALRSILLGARRKATRPTRSCGPRLPISGPTPPTAFPKLPTPSSKSIAPCRLGFNWELGPFELWDAAGVDADRRAHEERRQARRRQRREAAGFGQNHLVRRRPSIASGRKYFDIATERLQSR